ncbi:MULTISPECIES: transcriptional coactivator p15/PC4 family protein [Bradyrhizobium]|uniref:transcriptional coactivator p15/PC4 family protein n=1 Tax=Bradyrhizobium TaxID=374 RepID=UPI001ED9FAC4|nr:transcriptional coactivator p15/PC4 family protein [Bradyrhizobium zhengyangense]MCG2639655.1 transcriptional coactivator p15/PC4 family protein [Bradyrhizobium zhengyangense]
MAKRPEIAEPIEVYKGWINRKHDAVVVNLQTWQGNNLVDIRKWIMDRDGRLKASPKGIAISVRRLRDLHNALGRAIAKAEELKLIDGEDAE